MREDNDVEFKIPSGFTGIYAALTQRGGQNVMGVVTDMMHPAPSKGTDWMMTFNVADSSSGYGEGQKVKCFCYSEQELPKIHSLGDVVILRSIKTTEWNGTKLFSYNKNVSTWTVFPSESIPHEMPASEPQLKYFSHPRAASIPGPSEMRYAITLYNSQYRRNLDPSLSGNGETPLRQRIKSPGASSKPGNKFSLIKDIKVATFYDLVGEVVKLYTNQSNVELSVTDYTSNSLLFNYEMAGEETQGRSRPGDEFCYAPQRARRKWLGPVGKRTLTVTLWSPHNYFARSKVKEHDYVHLRNVHIKWSGSNKLEGVLHTDNRHPDRIDITILTSRSDDRVRALLERKLDYKRQFQVESQNSMEEVQEQKRKRDETGGGLSKKEMKKRRKQLRDAPQVKLVDAKNRLHGSGDDRVAKESPIRMNSKMKLNENVRCIHPSVPTRTLSSILNRSTTHRHSTPEGVSFILPFQNTCSRIAVRVVDFFPHRLEDFAVSHKTSEFDVLSDYENEQQSGNSVDNSSADDGPERQTVWEWRFCLLVEDATVTCPHSKAKERIKLYVVGQDADFLLKKDAKDLRNNPKALAQLRESLFILWGDLEERKTMERQPGYKPSVRSTKVLQDVSGNRQKSAKTPNTGKPTSEKPSALPFQCCIKEYGVRTKPQVEGGGCSIGGGEEGKEDEITDLGDSSEWQRRWRMFGTTIV